MTTPTARQTPLLALLVARAISESGTMLSGVALPLFVLSLTESVAQLGLITALQTVPLFVMGLIGGPAVDRLGARRVSVLTDLIALLAFGAVPLLAALGSL
ncbi:MFS transporter, partial [Candidatus Gracilibacteria bacterium]|nr:MFS transporter [Candidatus Gracilibacteria bacterium]